MSQEDPEKQKEYLKNSYQEDPEIHQVYRNR